MDNEETSKLIQSLKDGSKTAAVELSKLAKNSPKEAKPATDALIETFRNSEDINEQKGRAASALAHISREYPEETKEIESELIDLCTSDNSYNQQNAILALAALEAEGATQTLEKVHHKTSETHTEILSFLALNSIRDDSDLTISFEHIDTFISDDILGLRRKAKDESDGKYTAVMASLIQFVEGERLNQIKNGFRGSLLYQSDGTSAAIPILCDQLRTIGIDDTRGEYILRILSSLSKYHHETIADALVERNMTHLCVRATKSDSVAVSASGVSLLDNIASHYPEEVESHYNLIQSQTDHKKGWAKTSAEYAISKLDDYRERKIEDRSSDESDPNIAGVNSTGNEVTESAEVEEKSDKEEDISDMELSSEPTLTEDSTEYDTQKVISRDATFSEEIREAYNNTCAICGRSRKTPDGTPEVEAAHIYPKSEGGVDDIRNGIALCRLHHWAFDNGWISISDDHEILVKNATGQEGYYEFKQLEGNQIRLPEKEDIQPQELFLKEHRKLHDF